MRRIFLSWFLLIACGVSFGLDVNKTELESVANQRIQFLNYQGPPSKVETIQEIRGIGSYLGQGIGTAYATRDYFGKYRVIHAVDPTVKEKLDADIFILEAGSQVDHIDNVRRIIQGYLEAAYGYDAADSKLLAYFVTIYNAVHRGNMVFFSERYKPIVLKNVSAQNVGIATRYSDWPGKTRMVIPLNALAARGTLGSLSPTELVGPRVIDEIRTRQDMGIEQRKAMVNLMERAIQQKQQQLQRLEAQKPVAQSSPEKKAAVAAAKKPSTELPPVTKESPKQEAAVAAKPSPTAAPAAQAKQPSAATSSQSTAAAVQETKKQIEQLQQGARKQREQIARDQNLLLKKQPTQPKAAATQGLSPVTFLQVEDTGGAGVTGPNGVTLPYGHVVKINPLTFEPVETSTVKTVLGRNILMVGQDQRPVVIAMKGSLPESAQSATSSGGSSTQTADAVLTSPDMGRLVQLDPKTLLPAIVGTDVIFPASILVQNGGTLYAVMRDAGGWHLGRFSTDLKLVERSAVDVNPFTTITFHADRVWVQTADNRVIPLLVQDLRVAH